MLKLDTNCTCWDILFQPPSGGCVLKPCISVKLYLHLRPAAFGRLCVETISRFIILIPNTTSRLRAAVC